MRAIPAAAPFICCRIKEQSVSDHNTRAAKRLPDCFRRLHNEQAHTRRTLCRTLDRSFADKVFCNYRRLGIDLRTLRKSHTQTEKDHSRPAVSPTSSSINRVTTFEQESIHIPGDAPIDMMNTFHCYPTEVLLDDVDDKESQENLGFATRFYNNEGRSCPHVPTYLR